MAGIVRVASVEADYLGVIQALDASKEGEILLINTNSSTLAYAGQLFAAEAIRRRLAGLVVNGGVRDAYELRQMSLPVYSRYLSPKAGTCIELSNSRNQAKIVGYSICNGDYMFGDDDGIIVVNKNMDLQGVLERAIALKEEEDKVLERIRSGISLIDTTNFSDHVVKIRDNSESKLSFTVD